MIIGPLFTNIEAIVANRDVNAIMLACSRRVFMVKRWPPDCRPSTWHPRDPCQSNGVVGKCRPSVRLPGPPRSTGHPRVARDPRKSLGLSSPASCLRSARVGGFCARACRDPSGPSRLARPRSAPKAQRVDWNDRTHEAPGRQSRHRQTCVFRRAAQGD